MPARPKTPSPARDEPKYLTVAWPYPPGCNMEIEGDLKEFVFWISGCIGPDPLLSVFHKPSSPNMLIIEVLRDFDRWESVLGEHKWSEFLKEQDEEYKDKVSRIFYCTYNSGRQVQKHGWLRKDVQSQWFRQWPKNMITKKPYPPTRYCPTPQEDQTNAPLCRPLPVASFPPPPPPSTVRVPPVGTPQWLKMKEEGTLPPGPHNQPRSAWQRGPPSSAPGSTKAGPTRAAPALASGIARPLPPSRILTGPAGITLPRGINSPGILPSPSSNTLTSPPNSARDSVSSAWSGTSPVLTRGNSVASGSSPDSYDNKDVIVTVEQLADAINELDMDDELYEALDTSGWGPPPGRPTPAAPPPVPDIWEGYVFKEDRDKAEREEKGEEEKEEEEPKEPEIVCPIHEHLCSNGICETYKTLKRKQDKQKAAEKRKAEIAKREEEKKKNGNTGNQGYHKKFNLLPPREPPTPYTWRESATRGPPTNAPPPAVATPTALVPPTTPANGNAPPSPSAPAPTLAPSAAPVPAPRPPRGRQMNVAKGAGPRPAAAAPPSPVIPKTVGPPSVVSDDWSSNISNGPWGAPVNTGNGGNSKGKNKKNKNKKGPRSVISDASWPSRPPSVFGDDEDEADDGDDNKTVNGGKGKGKGKERATNGLKKSWADQVEEEENRSVRSNTTSGWTNASTGFWK